MIVNVDVGHPGCPKNSNNCYDVGVASPSKVWCVSVFFDVFRLFSRGGKFGPSGARSNYSSSYGSPFTRPIVSVLGGRSMKYSDELAPRFKCLGVSSDILASRLPDTL